MSELFEIVEGGVAVVRLVGGKANAMNRELLERIDAAFEAVAHSQARAVVVTGYGRFFSSGLALPLLYDLDRPAMKQFIEGFNAAMVRVFACPLPVVAAVNGHAIAGGCVLALQADWRVMADGDFKIGLNEVQLGIGLPSVVIESLRMLVPARTLVPIALEGQLLSPTRARELGLVEEVVAALELEARALERARQLAVAPASGYAQVKAALRRPILDAIERTGAVETERWLDSWFSTAARERIGETVKKLTAR